MKYPRSQQPSAANVCYSIHEPSPHSLVALPSQLRPGMLRMSGQYQLTSLSVISHSSMLGLLNFHIDTVINTQTSMRTKNWIKCSFQNLSMICAKIAFKQDVSTVVTQNNYNLYQLVICYCSVFSKMILPYIHKSACQ